MQKLQLMKDLPPPLGLHGLGEEHMTNAKLMRFIRKCNIPILDGSWVRYKDALYSIFLHAMHTGDDGTGENGGGGDDDSASNWQPMAWFKKPIGDNSQFMSDIDGGEKGAADDARMEGGGVG